MSVVLKRVSLLVALLCLASLVRAEEPSDAWELSLLEGSKLWIEGDSTLHAFECDAEVLEVESTVALKVPPATEGTSTVLVGGKDAAKITSMVFTVPIEHMTSHIVGLAAQMRRALKAKDYPNITFVMDDYSVENAVPENGGEAMAAEAKPEYEVTATGDLTLAGVTNRIEIAMTGSLNDDHVHVQGAKTLLMTDYGVKPPTLMFGAIKTHDEIVVKWDLLVGLKQTERRSEPIGEHAAE